MHEGGYTLGGYTWCITVDLLSIHGRSTVDSLTWNLNFLSKMDTLVVWCRLVLCCNHFCFKGVGDWLFESFYTRNYLNYNTTYLHHLQAGQSVLVSSPLSPNPGSCTQPEAGPRSSWKNLLAPPPFFSSSCVSAFFFAFRSEYFSVRNFWHALR